MIQTSTVNTTEDAKSKLVAAGREIEIASREAQRAARAAARAERRLHIALTNWEAARAAFREVSA